MECGTIITTRDDAGTIHRQARKRSCLGPGVNVSDSRCHPGWFESALSKVCAGGRSLNPGRARSPKRPSSLFVLGPAPCWRRVGSPAVATLSWRRRRRSLRPDTAGLVRLATGHHENSECGGIRVREELDSFRPESVNKGDDRRQFRVGTSLFDRLKDGQRDPGLARQFALRHSSESPAGSD